MNMKTFGYGAFLEPPKPGAVEKVEYPLGVMHYKRKKPGKVSFTVSHISPKHSMYFAEKGWKDTKGFELAPAMYERFLRDYIACEGDLCAGFNLGFRFILNNACDERDPESVRVLHSHFPELEQQRLIRTIEGEKADHTQLGEMFWHLTLHGDLFQRSLKTVADLPLEDRLVFLECLVYYVSIEHETPRFTALKDMLAQTVCVVFPDTANPASAALAVDSLDFKAHTSYRTLLGFFERKAPPPKTLELPKGFQP